MTAPRSTDELLQAFLAEGLTELPDRAYDAVLREIHETRQKAVIAGQRVPGLAVVRWSAVAATAVVAIAIALSALRPGIGPGGTSGPSPTAAPIPSVVPSTVATPALPTTFTSPLYGYTVTVPGGWLTAPAVLRWDGVRQPGPDAEVDKFPGPDRISMSAFAGPWKGTLAAFVADRIAANHRDQADTCPNEKPDINEPVSIGGRPGNLLGWNCGAVINQAVIVRNGVAFSFSFRDLGIRAASDPADSVLFQSILDSVVFPS
jgi:hypothetical protein